MFASPQTPFRQTGHYTPSRPSPLNISTPPWTMSPTRPTNQGRTTLFQTEPATRHTQSQLSPIPLNMNSSNTFAPTFNAHPPSSPNSPSSPTRPKPKYEARYAATIANPLKTGLARSRTRKMFLNRVRNDRDEGRFEARGEQMMHMEHLADRRRWEESMAREGEIAELDFEEDDMLPGMFDVYVLGLGLLMRIDDADVLDELISQEDMEMAMREAQAQAQAQLQGQGQGYAHGRVDQLRGNDEVPFSDDDYDDIFMRLQEQSQDMDMS
ncbi:unnamed protein product [Penicillium olsonii]|uniref:Uncharacterized protein n=1 Tax=Penicillium olsonii TaxID=99116 RepID=A0A9W4HKF4_PENOL|nr:unnamed protein product [Penicillium olsonii]